VPALVSNIQRQQQTTQLKNLIASIQQIAANQMIIKHTKSLADTDFASVDKLFSDKNFNVVKSCEAANAFTDCWGGVSGQKNYKTIKGKEVMLSPYTKTFVLKNGMVIAYSKYNSDTSITGTNEKVYGIFYVDLNGKDKPNRIGRDYFSFYISDKGKIYGITNPQANNSVSNCTNNTGGGFHCTQIIMNNGWKMDY